MNDSSDELSPMDPVTPRDHFRHTSPSNFYPSTHYNELYKHPSSLIPHDAMRYQALNPDISFSSETLLLQTNICLPNIFQYSRSHQPITPPQFCFPSSFLFHNGMRGHVPPLHNMSLHEEAEKFCNFLHPTAMNSSDNIYIG